MLQLCSRLSCSKSCSARGGGGAALRHPSHRNIEYFWRRFVVVISAFFSTVAVLVLNTADRACSFLSSAHRAAACVAELLKAAIDAIGAGAFSGADPHALATFLMTFIMASRILSSVSRRLRPSAPNQLQLQQLHSPPSRAVASCDETSMPPYSIMFFGTDSFSLPTLALLASSPALARRIAVMCPQDAPSGRGMKSQPCAVKQFALQHSLPVASLPLLFTMQHPLTVCAGAPSCAAQEHA